MGQFLAIGLAIKIGVKKSELDKTKLSVEQLQEKMQQDMHYVPDIYAASDDDTLYYFTLKDDILHAQLRPFLQTLYPRLYPEAGRYAGILDTLATRPPSEWLQWAKEKSEEAFQFDEYGMWDSVEENHQRICLYYDCLLLSLEGKIVMEVFGRQFNFLKYAMMQTFKQFSLSGALRIYITG